jgi:glycosyltransferase AglI
LITVIIPVYNDPEGLGDTLSSLIEQDYPNNKYEIIVVDNGSNDNTLDVAKKYTATNPELIKFTVEDKIQSSYAARNKGLGIASGDIIAFIDSDCVADKQWLKSGVSYLEDAEIAAVAGRIKFTYLDDNPNFWEYFDSARKLNQRSYVENSGFGATANFFVRKEIVNKYGLFRDDLISGGDYEFGRRITDRNETIVFGEGALVLHKARTTFSSILSKSSRVASGQKVLTRLGLLNHGVVTWRTFLPARVAPDLKGYNINLTKKISYIFVKTFFSYYNFFRRL